MLQSEWLSYCTLPHIITINSKLSHLTFTVHFSDVFKITLNTIHVSDTYQTRDVNKNFVEGIKGAMLEKLSLDSVVYLATVGNPFDDNYILKEDSQLYILGGTHYL